MDNTDEQGRNRRGKATRPLDVARLNELALAYVARFATSAGRLSAYLGRKLREHGWADDTAPDVPALVASMVERGYVDDAGFALARGAGMMRRGYGARRIAQTLTRDGIEPPLVVQASGTEQERRLAALAFAQRRRLGPFGRGSAENGDRGHGRLDPAMRTRQVAAMMRAGHPMSAAWALIDAADAVAAQEWVDEADDA